MYIFKRLKWRETTGEIGLLLISWVAAITEKQDIQETSKQNTFDIAYKQLQSGCTHFCKCCMCISSLMAKHKTLWYWRMNCRPARYELLCQEEHVFVSP